MFKDFPSLHPLAVHFPIVLILLAAALQAVLVWKDLKQIKWVTLVIIGGAFFSSLAASTIFHAEPSVDAPKAALEIFEQHEKYAQLTLWMSGITFLLKSIGVFFKINRRSFEIIVLIAAIIAAVFLSIAGHHGAKLTHVAGVGPMGKYLMKGHGEGGDMEDMKDMDMKNDSSMKMTDTMPGMNNMDKMPGMDNMKKDSSMNMKSMKDMTMPGMDKNAGMKDMKGMKGMKGMDKMKDMKNMSGMDKMKDMKDMKMDSSMNMKDMNNMPGMDKMKMDSSGNMKDMNNMPGMDNMKMPAKNPMDTLRFPDNNPARKKNYKQHKQ
ncbi:MAG: DUF2231 domain-containing protein [Sediminibacterium sp.]|jgi:uncharacterized membrane protein|uniref:DUF2231 domain-containing protein n=5 Tax=Bacteria TaxID=2 RepID=UPI0004B12CA5|nr:DUF2231 domain-containing protein [Asinibacterium sp. OR53]MCA6445602.1 hypothetical protein [Chitinophagaceae bacterium]